MTAPGCLRQQARPTPRASIATTLARTGTGETVSFGRRIRRCITGRQNGSDQG